MSFFPPPKDLWLGPFKEEVAELARRYLPELALEKVECHTSLVTKKTTFLFTFEAGLTLLGKGP